MTAFLERLRLRFAGAAKVQPPPRSDRRRDPELECLARERILPHAPELAPLLIVGWNPRMRTTAGVAVVSRGEIWLNPALKTLSAEEVERTLLHELAHLLASHRHGRRRIAPHGGEWRVACSDLGIPGERSTHRLPFVARRMRRRFLLRCPACGESHERVRLPRGRVACLACCRRHHGGRYHEHYRLEILTKEEGGGSPGGAGDRR
jgi:predicted SprT family Zn-dependent metalloprotease